MFTPPSIRPGGLAALAARAARALFAGISAWNRRRRGRIAAKQLLGWSDHMLNDIGLNRADVRCALRGHRKREATTRLRVMAVERRALALRDAREEFDHATAKGKQAVSGRSPASGEATSLDQTDEPSDNPNTATGASNTAQDAAQRMDRRAA